MSQILANTPFVSGLLAQSTDEQNTQTRNAFLELIQNVTDLVNSLLPSIDLNSLGPFSGWATNLIVLVATFLCIWAFLKVLTGWAKSTFMSGGDKEKIKEGKAQMRSAGIFLGVILGLGFVFSMIGWFVSYVTS